MRKFHLNTEGGTVQKSKQGDNRTWCRAHPDEESLGTLDIVSTTSQRVTLAPILHWNNLCQENTMYGKQRYVFQ